MIDDLLGGVVGVAIGERLGEHARAWIFGRKCRSAAARGAGRARAALVRPEGSWPRHRRGAIVRTGDRLRWRPFLRRWHTVDLTDAVVIGCSRISSEWNGQHVLINLARTDPIRQLRVTPQRVELVETLFGAERWLSRSRKTSDAV